MSEIIIRKYCLVRFAVNLSLSFFFPIYTVFLMGAGLNLLEVNLVNTCYMMTCLLLDFPCGSFADNYGRKLSLMIACLLLCLSFLAYSQASTFAQFIVAETIGAIGTSFYSGSMKSWMVDEINLIEESFDFKRAHEVASVWKNAGIIIGSLMGSYLASVNMTWPWIASAIAIFLSGLVFLVIIKENRIVKKEKKAFRNFWQTMKVSATTCWLDTDLRLAVCLGFFLGMACAPLNMYWQPYFQTQGLDTKHLYWLFILIIGTLLVGNKLSTHLQNKLRCEKRIMVTILFVFGFGALISVMPMSLPIILPMFLLHELARGVHQPFMDNYLNRRIESENRTTINSFLSTTATAGMGLGLLISGIIAENASIESSWIFSALIAFAFATYVGLKSSQEKK